MNRFRDQRSHKFIPKAHCWQINNKLSNLFQSKNYNSSDKIYSIKDILTGCSINTIKKLIIKKMMQGQKSKPDS